MFRVNREPDALAISFSASLENVDRADALTREFVTDHTGAVPAFELMLLLREALNNAVQWGSDLDPCKTVCYRLSTGPCRWILEVADEGRGFDWQAMMLQGVLPTEDHGRGLSIMQKYAKDVKYNNDGNRLRLTFHTVFPSEDVDSP